MNTPQPKALFMRKPHWLKVRPAYDEGCRKIRSTIADLKLHTVCQEAACPNIAECFQSGTATFLILGSVCTRNCLYCNVVHGIPQRPDEAEISNLIEAVHRMNLNYVVITSVTRDDLPDGGAQVFADCITALRREVPGCRIEVLIPDFEGRPDALQKVIDASPEVINHNMEVVLPFYSRLRPQGNYDRSLELLARLSKTTLISKSGFMVGFGEQKEDILHLMEDLASVSCRRLTIGQYQQPTRGHWPVARYYAPEEFAELADMAREMGFEHVESGPLVRSSYHAAQASQCPPPLKMNQTKNILTEKTAGFSESTACLRFTNRF